MSAKKLFNPKKCPYKQLEKHKGEAIVLLYRTRGRKKEIYRMRHITSEKRLIDQDDYWKTRKEGFSEYSDFPRYFKGERDMEPSSVEFKSHASRSCFDADLEDFVGEDTTLKFVKKSKRGRPKIIRKIIKRIKYTYPNLLQMMKEYDSRSDLSIFHIDFN